MEVLFPENLQRRYSLLATRSKAKITESEATYKQRGELLALDPEELSGEPEADLPDVAEVAWLKTEILKGIIQNIIENHPGEVAEFFSDGVLIGVDVSVVINDFLELKKLSREMGWDDKVKIAQAKTQTSIMFCQGIFKVVWKVGFAVRTMDGSVNNVTTLQIASDFTPLTKEEIDAAFENERVLHDCSRVNLIDMVGAHATNLSVSNEAGDVLFNLDFTNPDDLQLLHLMVVGCVMPQVVIDQLATPTTKETEERFNRVLLNNQVSQNKPTQPDTEVRLLSDNKI